MPLKTIPKNASKQTENRIVGENIALLRKEGKTQKQAQAIALNKAQQDKRKQRRGYKK